MENFSYIISSALPYALEKFIIPTGVGVLTHYITKKIDENKLNISPNQLESLKDDFCQYLNELIADLKLENENLPIGGESLFGPIFNNLQKGKFEEQDIVNIVESGDSTVEIEIKDYLKNGSYKETLRKAQNKGNAYMDVINECIKNYGEGNKSKLEGERKNLSEFIINNITDIKRFILDFTLSKMMPISEQEIKEGYINQSINQINFEKYLPAFRRFLDKVDNRILAK